MRPLQDTKCYRIVYFRPVADIAGFRSTPSGKLWGSNQYQDRIALSLDIANKTLQVRLSDDERASPYLYTFTELCFHTLPNCIISYFQPLNIIYKSSNK